MKVELKYYKPCDQVYLHSEYNIHLIIVNVYDYNLRLYDLLYSDGGNCGSINDKLTMRSRSSVY